MTVDSSRQVDNDAIELDDGVACSSRPVSMQVQQLDEEKDFDPCGLEEATWYHAGG